MFKYLKKAYIMSLASYFENNSTRPIEQKENNNKIYNKLDAKKSRELLNGVLDDGILDKEEAKILAENMEKVTQETKSDILDLAKKIAVVSGKITYEDLNLIEEKATKEGITYYAKSILSKLSKEYNIQTLEQDFYLHEQDVSDDAGTEDYINQQEAAAFNSDSEDGYGEDINKIEQEQAKREYKESNKVPEELQEKFNKAKEWYRLHGGLENSSKIRDIIQMLSEEGIDFDPYNFNNGKFDGALFNAIIKYQTGKKLNGVDLKIDGLVGRETLGNAMGTIDSRESMKEYYLNSHIIKPGDTLWKIAKKNNISIKDIKKLNPGIKATKLKIGQKIYLPKNEKNS